MVAGHPDNAFRTAPKIQTKIVEVSSLMKRQTVDIYPGTWRIVMKNRNLVPFGNIRRLDLGLGPRRVALQLGDGLAFSFSFVYSVDVASLSLSMSCIYCITLTIFAPTSSPH